MADQTIPLPGGGVMPRPRQDDPGGAVRHPNGAAAPVSPRPGAPAATIPWPYGSETKPAPVIGNPPRPGGQF